MTIPFFLVDAFTGEPFKGNVAGVCLVDESLSDMQMQQIAMEVNVSETAFVFRMDKNFSLRWFTPLVEVSLFGSYIVARRIAC